MTKDIRVAIKNANCNEKLYEERKKKAYDMARHVQYLKDGLEDLRDKPNCLQVEVVNLQGLKRSVELIAGNLDRDLLEIQGGNEGTNMSTLSVTLMSHNRLIQHFFNCCY